MEDARNSPDWDNVINKLMDAALMDKPVAYHSNSGLSMIALEIMPHSTNVSEKTLQVLFCWQTAPKETITAKEKLYGGNWSTISAREALQLVKKNWEDRKMAGLWSLVG